MSEPSEEQNIEPNEQLGSTEEPQIPEQEQRAFNLIEQFFKECFDPNDNAATQHVGELNISYSDKDRSCHIHTSSINREGLGSIYAFDSTPIGAQIYRRESKVDPDNPKHIQNVSHVLGVTIANKQIGQLVDVLKAIKHISELTRKPDLTLTDTMNLDILSPETQSKFIAYIKSLVTVENTL